MYNEPCHYQNVYCFAITGSSLSYICENNDDHEQVEEQASFLLQQGLLHY